MGIRTSLGRWLLRSGNRRPKPLAMFESARQGRLTYSLISNESSADSEIRGSIKMLRNRARSLARDSVHARAIKRTYRVNIFGERGIRMQPQVRRVESSEMDKLRNDLLTKEWKYWCRKDSCDVSGMNSFHAFEMDIGSALIESGEVFFRIVRGRRFGRSAVPMALEVIESDRLDHECNEISDRPGHIWRLGIERDEWGRATRYKFKRDHPGDYELRGVRPRREQDIVLDAADVIHVYGVRERVQQTRMEPVLTPIIPKAWHLSKYQEAHLIRKRVQANQLGWIQTPDGEFLPDDREDGTGRKIINAEAGQYRELDPGQTVVPPDLGPEDSQYESVNRVSLREQAAGTGTSYASISRDFSDSNYSSLKISTSEDRDWWRVLQTAIVEQFHQRVYEEWIYTAIMYGALPVATFQDYWYRPERYLHPRWQCRTWGLLDPAKEMKAMRDERDLQLKTHRRQVMEYAGDEYEDLIDGLEDEIADKRERGLLKAIDDPAAEQQQAESPPDSSGDLPESAR